MINNQLEKICKKHFVMILISAIFIVVLAALLTKNFHAFRHVLALAIYFSVLLCVSLLTLSFIKKINSKNVFKSYVIAFSAFTFACFTAIISPHGAVVHPVFNTPLTGGSINRPAIYVDVIDDDETPIFGTLELYLNVSSSRFPNDVKLTFPVNVGDFRGVNKRFIQLPFEVVKGDVIVFNLLDEDSLTEQQETLLISTCELTGYCLIAALKIYKPEVSAVIEPGFMSYVEVLGESFVDYYQYNDFENVGSGTYIVNESRPKAGDANTVSLIKDGFSGAKYVHANVKVYFPESELD